MLKEETKGKKKLGKSIRTRGNSYERQVAEEMRELGWKKCCTSRAESRNKDSEGIDLCNTTPLNIQCKCLNIFKNPIEPLSKMPSNNGYYNVIFMKVVHKGEYVVLSKQDFYDMLEVLKTEDIF